MLVTAAAGEGRCGHVVLGADVFFGHCCFPQSARFINVVARDSTLQQLVHSVSKWPEHRWQHAKVVECDECVSWSVTAVLHCSDWPVTGIGAPGAPDISVPVNLPESEQVRNESRPKAAAACHTALRHTHRGPLDGVSDRPRRLWPERLRLAQLDVQPVEAC